MSLAPSRTSRGVLEAQVAGADGAAVVCVVPGGPVALTLGDGRHVVTVQFDGPQALALADVLTAAARRTKG